MLPYDDAIRISFGSRKRGFECHSGVSHTPRSSLILLPTAINLSKTTSEEDNYDSSGNICKHMIQQTSKSSEFCGVKSAYWILLPLLSIFSLRVPKTPKLGSNWKANFVVVTATLRDISVAPNPSFVHMFVSFTALYAFDVFSNAERTTGTLFTSDRNFDPAQFSHMFSSLLAIQNGFSPGKLLRSAPSEALMHHRRTFCGEQRRHSMLRFDKSAVVSLHEYQCGARHQWLLAWTV